MAGGAIIGALRVVLGADTAQLEKGLKNAQGSLASFGKAVASIAGGIGLEKSLEGLGRQLVETFTGGLKAMDGFSKQSQKIGVPVEELSALKLAADLSDVSMDSLGKSLGKLSKNMVEAAAKPTSEAATAFKALGVSVVDSDGHLKSSSQTMGDIAGKFEGLKDGAGKTAISMALFGKSGADLIPLLNSGKSGIEDMKKEAEELGIVFSSQTAKSAEAFNDNLTRLGAVLNGVVIGATARLLPDLLKLSEILVQNAKDGSLAKASADLIGASLLKLTEVVMTVITGWQRLGVEWAAFREFMQTDVFSGKVAENWAKFQETGKETQRVMASLHASFENDPLGNSSNGFAANTDKASKSLKDFNYSAMSGKNAVDQFIDSQKKSLASQQATLQADGMAAGAKERLKIVLQAYQIAATNNIPVTDALRASITALGLQAEQTALKIQGQQLIQQVTPIWQQYTQELNNNAAALRAVGATGEQLATSAGKTAEKYGLSWKQQVPSVVGSFAEIASAFGSEGSKMAAAAKVLGAVQALISTYAGSAEALNLPFPANIAASAAVLAKGLGLVAAIKSAVVPKMATGGVFNVPGGIGGGDKVPISFLAQAGEQVKVEPNRYGQNRGSESSQAVTVVMQGEVFSRAFFAKMVDGINGAVRDGYRLQVAPV